MISLSVVLLIGRTQYLEYEIDNEKEKKPATEICIYFTNVHVKI